MRALIRGRILDRHPLSTYTLVVQLLDTPTKKIERAKKTTQPKLLSSYCYSPSFYIINMKFPLAVLLTSLLAVTQGFTAVTPRSDASSLSSSSLSLSSSALFAANVDRRSILSTGILAGAAGLVVSLGIEEDSVAWAVEPKTVVVAGATGQTGRRILERLAAIQGVSVVAGVRNVDKAQTALAESSTVLRGAMIQQVGSVDTSKVNLQHLDIVLDSSETLEETLKGADSLIIAVGFVPGNPLKMNDEAHKVDNVGTIKLIDAAKAAGVKKVVMVSSILTNGRAWGQEKSPGFVITNAFGKVLDEKIVAENHLRASGLDYTIVRPGGLKAQPRT